MLAVNEMIPGLSRPAGSGPATARGAADVVLHEIVLMLVIMLSGDVELNPGPPKSTKTAITPQLHHLMNLLAEISHKYSEIGVALKVPMHAFGLHPLPQYYNDNLRQTLQWWIDNGPMVDSPVTYDNIINAVKGPIVENFRVSEKIREFYEQLKEGQPTISDDLPVTGTSQPTNNTNPPLLSPDNSSITDILQNGLQQSPYVTVNITQSALMGPPGVGKTAFKALLFGQPAVTQHKSTPLAVPPVRAIRTNRYAKDDGGEWLNIENNPEILFRMLADTIKHKSSSNAPESNVADVPSASSLPTVKPLSTPLPLEPSEVQEVVDQIHQVEGTGELFATDWYYLLDTGGQPQFADISRPFICTKAIYFILTKLTEKLHDRPNFCFSDHSGKPLVIPSELSMTNLELIKYFMSSIMSITYEGDISNDEASVPPFVAIIGTHYDEYQQMLPNDDHYETIEEKNKVLLGELNEFQRHLIYTGKLLYTVDNVCTGPDRERISQYLREQLLYTIHQKITPEKLQIPIKHYIFDILVKNEIKSTENPHGVLTIGECNIIAEKLKMTSADVMEVLRFYDSLNLYLYFDIPFLRHIVFTNPQYPLDLLCKLIQATFVDFPSLPPTSEFRDFRNDGMLHKSLLDHNCFKLPFVPLHFQQEHLLMLLTYARVIFPISPYKYFMPVVLPWTYDQDPDVMIKSYTEKAIDPIYIKFKHCRSVPQGVFLTFIVNLLINRKVTPTFSISKQKQLRYSIELSFDSSRGYLLLIDEFKWIKLYYDHYSKTNIITKVRDAVSEAIDACVTKLSYHKSALDHGYLPPCSEDKSHPIREIFIEEGDARCDCKRKLQKLQKGQLCWFSKGQPTSECTVSHEAVDIDSSSVIHNSPRDYKAIMKKEPKLNHLTEVLAPIQHRYKSLGIQLEVNHGTIDGIKESNDANDVKLMNVLTKWIENRHPPVTWETIIDIVGRNVIDNNEVKEDIIKFLEKSDVFNEYAKKADFCR